MNVVGNSSESPLAAPVPPRYEMARNESRYGPSLAVVQAVQESVLRVNQHLDIFGSGLSAALGAELGVPADHVVVGAGSAALLQQLLGSRAGGGEVVQAWPSFEAYPVMASAAGLETVRVPLREYRHDLEKMAAAVTDRTRVVLLCNPNNPTGTVLGEQEIQRFLGAVSHDVLIIVDEAYREFADQQEIADGIGLYRDDERVCVVRTFSKAYGLLGLRVGYTIAHPSVAAAVRSTLPFFRANTIGQAAALAALREGAQMRDRCVAVACERDRMREVLLALGWPVPTSGGNFLYLPLGSDSKAFVDFCAERGVVLWGLPGEAARVTVGEAAANEAFLALAAEFATQPDADSEAGSPPPVRGERRIR